MQRKIETFQVVPAKNFRKEEVLYRFTRSKYFKCYGNLSVISFNFVNQLKAFAAVFFSQAPEWELDSYAKSRVISLECCLRVGQIANLPIFLGILQFGYSEQTGVISTSTRHFDFPPSGRLSRSPRTRWLAAQPRLRAAQRCVVVVLSDLPKRLRCQVRILFISPRKGKEVQMYLPFSYVCNAFVQDQLRDLIFR